MRPGIDIKVVTYLPRPSLDPKKPGMVHVVLAAEVYWVSQEYFERFERYWKERDW